MSTKSGAIAIVGIACCYPDAGSPQGLWENVLAQRRAFRRIPAQRLRLEDYYSADRNAADRTYASEAAVIADYTFDRVAFRVTGNSYRSSDLAHWLALDVASQALQDAGFIDSGRGATLASLPRESTGVLLGNTLTGEFSRANTLRLRWPYVRRVVEAALSAEGWEAGTRNALMERLEADYKAPFPPVNEETLAGGLSNTIAGRICNYFDLKGGGYTLDGACASSLLAVTNACTALAAGDLDVALAGGVDLSLDPFELIGFAKTGALAQEMMRVYDARGNGFWPGEGCGFVVLMREEDALAQGLPIYACIPGWGVSSDGSGGLTRPELEGQLLAVQRAYRRAGYGVDTVGYFEGHGTGTAVGDAIELRMLTQARRQAGATDTAVIGSVKANIGHTKAAAGVAGLIKATLALHHEILPPTTGCEQPHAELLNNPLLRVLPKGEIWPSTQPLRASVSSMGFGGINAHLALERRPAILRECLTAPERLLLNTAQDTELLLFSASNPEELLQRVLHLETFAADLSRSDLADLAATLTRNLQESEVAAIPPGVHTGSERSHQKSDGITVRAALVTSSPAQLAGQLEMLAIALRLGCTRQFNVLNVRSGIFLSVRSVGDVGTTPRVGFLFPGQGSPVQTDGGIWRRRFSEVAALYANASLMEGNTARATEVAQPAIVTASLAGLSVLARMGIVGEVAIGHSLGELTALHWAGAFEASDLLEVARVRGNAMANLTGRVGATGTSGTTETSGTTRTTGTPETPGISGTTRTTETTETPGISGTTKVPGTMAGLEASEDEAQAWLAGTSAVIAGLNGPRQTVVSGAVDEVERVMARAVAAGRKAVRLLVANAFHSPLVAAAVPPLAACLERIPFAPLRVLACSTVTGAKQREGRDKHPTFKTVCSTVTGAKLPADTDLRALLCRQVTEPVRFLEALQTTTPDVDAWIEVGPGEVLGRLAQETVPSETPVVSLDAGGNSLRGLWSAVGLAHALGVSLDTDALFADRFTRPFHLDRLPTFFANPCESAPVTLETTNAVPLPSHSMPTEIETTPGRQQSGQGVDAGSTVPVEAPDLVPAVAQDSAAILRLLQEKIAAVAELPVASVGPDATLLGDLHLNSITVAQLMVETARDLGLAPLAVPTEFANATVHQVAEALEALLRTAGTGAQPVSRWPEGVREWVRPFQIRWVPVSKPPLESTQRKSRSGVNARTTGNSHTNGGTEVAPFETRFETRWQFFGATTHPLARALHDVLKGAFGDSTVGGVVVLLPDLSYDADLVQALLSASRAALLACAERETRFVVVQQGRVGGAFARTLHLEAPQLATCVVTVPFDRPEAAEWVVEEVRSGKPFHEARYDATGTRYEPILHLQPYAPSSIEMETASTAFDTPQDLLPIPLSAQDVLLVTGGGKGIAAECALAVARETGTRLVLLGRSSPERDAELASNLSRMERSGVEFRYYATDVTDPEAVAATVRQAEEAFGPISALLHGAGANTPRLIGDLTLANCERTLAPKIGGAQNVLKALGEASHLKLFIAFGSLIGRTGLHGEADYALANEWLARLTVDFQATHPACRCLALEWSVWSGVGMGERLGRIEALRQEGIQAISPDAGVEIFLRLLRGQTEASTSGLSTWETAKEVDTSLIVMGRLGELPTLVRATEELPLLRFLERSRLHYPGVELIVESDLSLDTDPYLADHCFQGDYLFPAVMGMEAMSQAAMALLGTRERPVVRMEAVRFDHPVIVPSEGACTLRLVALVTGPGCVEVALRCSSSQYLMDHFRTICRFEPNEDSALPQLALTQQGIERGTEQKIEQKIEQNSEQSIDRNTAIDEIEIEEIEIEEIEIEEIEIEEAEIEGEGLLVPQTHLYGRLLFQRGRFQRIERYRWLRATECVAEVSGKGRSDWFSAYLPQTLVAGDPGVRDACMHALQACIPHAFLLPTGIDRLVAHSRTGVPWKIVAREREQRGWLFIYDLELIARDGCLIERWAGLRLHRLEGDTGQQSWPFALIGPYLQRRMAELVPHAAPAGVMLAAIHRPGNTREQRRTLAIRQAVGRDALVAHRPDGKPELLAPSSARDLSVSFTHSGETTLVLTGRVPVACDLVAVSSDADMWSALMGQREGLARLVAGQAHEGYERAAARVWTVLECLKKVGASQDAPLTVQSTTRDGWVTLVCGPFVIATYVACILEIEPEMALGILIGREN